jgi:hypothetical protein
MIQFRNKVKKWMLSNYRDYVDPVTDELNCTMLAEQAANMFDLYNNDMEFDIPEEVFEWASEVSMQLKK